MVEIPAYRFFVMLIFIWILIIILILLMYKIFEMIEEKRKMSQLAEERIEENLINKFYENFDIVSKQITSEVLECLIEMEKLDEIYNQIIEKTSDFIDDTSYFELKESTLNKIIDEKIKDIETKTKKKESFKSLIDEIEACQKRFPQFNQIYVEKKNILKEKISHNIKEQQMKEQ